MSPSKIAITYYSAIHTMADRLEACVRAAADEERPRKVTGLAPRASIAGDQAWVEQVVASENIDIASADGVPLVTPARFGNVAGQLKQFLFTLGLLGRAASADRAYAGFTSSQTAHGEDESTLLALCNSVYPFGGVLVPPGNADPIVHVAMRLRTA